MGKPSHYEKVALELVPVNSHLSVVRLREAITRVFEREITAALTCQREQQFPDLAAERTRIEGWNKRLSDWDAEMKRKHQEAMEKIDQDRLELIRRVEELKTKEQQLAKVLQAVSEYMAWLDGNGAIDDNGRRFDNLLQACRQLQKGTKQ